MEFSTNQGFVLKPPSLLLTQGLLVLDVSISWNSFFQKAIHLAPLFYASLCSNIIPSKIFPNHPKTKEHPLAPAFPITIFLLFFIAFIGMWYIIIWILMLFIVHLSPSLSLRLELRCTCFFFLYCCFSCIWKHIFVEWMSLIQQICIKQSRYIRRC